MRVPSVAGTACALWLCGAPAWSRTGQPDRGLEWAERALAVDPEDAGVRYNVACLDALRGEPRFAALRAGK